MYMLQFGMCNLVQGYGCLYLVVLTKTFFILSSSQLDLELSGLNLLGIVEDL